MTGINPTTELDAVKVEELLAVLTFSINDSYYAVPIEDVIEVAAMVESIPVPDSKPELIGVINRHGTILPLLDVRRIFGVEPKPIQVSTLFIVASYKNQTVGLVVDAVFQVEYIEKAEIETTPAYGHYVRGIVTQDAMVIQIITLEPILSQFLNTFDELNELKSDSELWS